jgi:hypothetical protein
MLNNKTILIGTTFASNSQWHKDEIALVNSIKNQIDNTFAGNNLLINLTWFGPQFDNNEYQKIFNINSIIDNIFFLAAVDPVSLTKDQLDKIVLITGAKNSYFLGNFDSEYQFTFIATLLPKYFQRYSEKELLLKEPIWLYINYNRKPREHRIQFVKKLISNNLEIYGKISLGKHDPVYSSMVEDQLIVDQTPDYSQKGNWGMSETYGIAHDIHSLGNMQYWQNHFLTIVSETEFNPWDNMFITEKTWKPILGLRPFLINGQTKIYKYLCDNGFKTFNHYFNTVKLEDIPEYAVHDSIIDVIQYLISLDKKEILSMYDDMLPALRHNKERFFEFAQEQKRKIKKLI